MERLWAPWRMTYIRDPKRGGCFLCAAWRSRRDAEHHVLWRTRRTLVIMNRYPYTNAHLMVAPGAHRAHLERLSQGLLGELLATTQVALRALRRALRPHGFNVGFNLGEVAGAGLAKHLHLHLVPRWNGDTSYLPVLAETRVISQHLDETYAELRRFFPRT
jgi:ATP adenylyltransferase